MGYRRGGSTARIQHRRDQADRRQARLRPAQYTTLWLGGLPGEDRRHHRRSRRGLSDRRPVWHHPGGCLRHPPEQPERRRFRLLAIHPGFAARLRERRVLHSAAWRIGADPPVRACGAGRNQCGGEFPPPVFRANPFPRPRPCRRRAAALLRDPAADFIGRRGSRAGGQHRLHPRCRFAWRAADPADPRRLRRASARDHAGEQRKFPQRANFPQRGGAVAGAGWAGR